MKNSVRQVTLALFASILCALPQVGYSADQTFTGSIIVSNSVAIGTNVPGARLHVEGDALIAGALNMRNTNYNTIIQDPACPVPTNAFGSVAVGRSALTGAGANNVVALGNGAGQNSTGSLNTVVGGAAGYHVVGNDNVAVGVHSLRNVTGSRNTGVGDYAMYLGNGDDNVGVGYNSLAQFIFGQCNAALGPYALCSASGNNNIGVGVYAMEGARDNYSSIGIGEAAGCSATNGSQNIFIGMLSGLEVCNVSNVTLIGRNLKANKSNVMVLGDGQNVGIGTNDPAARLQVVGKILADGFIGGSSSASGQNASAGGSGSSASGTDSHAEGTGTIAVGPASHAEGVGTTSGVYMVDGGSHAEGYFTTASGGYGSHAEGRYTIASGASSHAEGANTEASSIFAHAEGYNSRALRPGAHAEGGYTLASNTYAHAEGCYTEALGANSHAAGYLARATNDYTYVWSDGSTNSVSTMPNQFSVFAQNGVRLIGGPVLVNTNSATTEKFVVAGDAKIAGALTLESGTNNTIIQCSQGLVSNVSYSAIFGGWAGCYAPGQFNSAVGYAAGFSATGSYNTVLGTYAGYFASGSYNVAVGSQANARNGGNYNVAIGNNALKRDTQSGGFGTGSNVAIGPNAMCAPSGDVKYNTSIGVSSFFGGMALTNSTAIGFCAGMSASNITESIFIGNYSGTNMVNVTNVTLIGKNLTTTRSDVMVLGNNQSVGVGTSLPNAKFHVAGAGRFDGGIVYVQPLGDLSMGTFTNAP